jgi:dTMP kinase
MFIVIEGIDGCGKTTQACRLAGWLEDRLGEGNVLSTREPGGWSGGKFIREFILGGSLQTRWGEFFAFMMDRCEHAERVITPALASGKCVLCDRYTPSTLAYQVFSDRRLPERVVRHMAALPDVVGLPLPDCICFLDIDAETARKRLEARGDRNPFDVRGDNFFARVRDGYYKMMAASPDVWIKVDASGSEDDVFGNLTLELGNFPIFGPKDILP